MQRISSLELVGKNNLEFDLFDEEGQVIYRQGEQLSPEIILKLNYINIYKRDSVAKKQIVQPVKKKPVKVYKRPKPVLKESTSQTLIKSSRNIFDRTYDGEALKYNECEQVSNIILSEVTAQFQNIKSVEQLRVFDEYTYSHNVNVSSIAVLFGIMLGLNEKQLEEIALGAFLHDIGKMKVPREILNKPGRLDNKELAVMRGHTYFGYKHIKETLDISDRIARIALDHQEKFGGKGYPNGLKSQEINFYAQITAIADVYDALVSERVYKKAMHPHDALEIILKDGENSFNPEFLDKFIEFTQKSETKDEE